MKRETFVKIVKILLVGAMVLFGSSFAWAENLVIKGSTTVLPIAQKVAEAYMKAHPETQISISGGGSGEGITALIDKTTNIADSSRFIKPAEVDLAVKKGGYPVPFRIAYDCIIPIVHPSNPVTDLTLDQLKAIYQGELTNWSKVGGPDLKIVVISRDTSSGTYEVWEEKVMNKTRVFPAALLQASNGAIVQAVSSNKNAIGYIGLGYLNNTVKATKVNGITGSEKTTLDAKYPISRPLFMFTNGWPSGETLNFINFTLDSKTGQPLVKESGFVPLN